MSRPKPGPDRSTPPDTEAGPDVPDPDAGAPPESLGFLLMAVGGHIRKQIEAGLQADDIALRHLSALGHLSRNPGVSYSELARRAGITPQSMQATLNSLEQRGAVRRESDPGRGRAAHLQVTLEGQRLIRHGMAVVRDVDDAVRAGLGTHGATTLGETLISLLAGVSPPER